MSEVGHARAKGGETDPTLLQSHEQRERELRVQDLRVKSETLCAME